jgi:uridine phosphorylase
LDVAGVARIMSWPWPRPEGVPADEPQHHLGLVEGDVPATVILPGDPKRTELIARRFEDAELVADQREFVTRRGTHAGVGIATTSTGIGCPSTAIAVEELANVGARNLIRLGTCGVLQPDIPNGSLILASAAVRGDGTSRQYVPPEFPALADPDLLATLRGAAEAEGIAHSVGVIRSHDAFFLESPWAHGDWAERVRPWTDRGVLAIENESSTLFVVSHLRGVRAATCLIAAGNLVTGVEPTQTELDQGLDAALTVVLGAAKRLEEQAT